MQIPIQISLRASEYLQFDFLCRMDREKDRIQEEDKKLTFNPFFICRKNNDKANLITLIVSKNAFIELTNFDLN